MANSMTKNDLERVITAKVRDIYADYKKFNPEGQYLNLVVVDNSKIMFWDGERIINHFETL